MANKDMKIRVSVDSKNAEQNLKSLDGGMQGMIKSIAGATAAFLVLKKGADFMIGSAKLLRADVKEIAKLDAIIKATGGAAGVTTKQMTDLAQEIQNMTGISNTSVMAAESMLLTFRKIGEDVLPRVTTAVADMSILFGSMDSAAIQVGKALNDPIMGITALRRVGITFSEEQKNMIKGFVEMNDIAKAQDVILTELENQFGGTAAAVALNTDHLKASFDDFRKMIAGDLEPLIQSFSGELVKLLKILSGTDIVEDAERQKRIAYATTFDMYKTKSAEQIQAAKDLNDTQRNEILGTISVIEDYQNNTEALTQTQLDNYNAAIKLANQYGINTKGIANSNKVQDEAIEGFKDELLRITQVNTALIDLTNRTKEVDNVIIGMPANLKKAVDELIELTQQEFRKTISLEFEMPEDIDEQIEIIEQLKTPLAEFQSWKTTAREAELAQIEEFEKNSYLTHAEAIEAKKAIDLEYNEWAMAGIDTIVSGYEKLITSMGDISATWDIVKQAGLSAIASITGEMLKQWIISKVIGKAQKKSTIGRATGNTAEAVTKTLAALPFPASAVPAAAVGAIGAAQVGIISASPYARGGDFVTNGPHLMLVGDNPGGQEHVSVTPTSSPNFEGPNNNGMIERLDILIDTISNLPIYNLKVIDDIELSRRTEHGTIQREVV